MIKFKNSLNNIDLSFNNKKERKEKGFFTSIIKECAKKHYKQARYIDNKLKSELPKNNEIIYIITKEKFNQFAFTLLVTEKEEIEELYISSFNVKQELLKTIDEMLKNNIIPYCKLIITWSIKKRTPEVYRLIKNIQTKHKNFDVVFCDNHSKISCIKTNKNHYIVSGSGNFTATNTKMENYIISNDKELYKFYIDWFNNQINMEEKYIK